MVLDHNPHQIEIQHQEQADSEILEQVMVLLVIVFQEIIQTALITKVAEVVV